MTAPKPPNRLMYWVEPGRLLAGGYPGHADPAIAERTLLGLLDCGVRGVVDLMEEPPRGAPPYGPRLATLGEARGCALAWRPLPIEDHGTPDPEALMELMSWIAAFSAEHGAVYAHCWGGKGRTGVLAAAWLLARGLADHAEVLSVLSARRAGAPGRSPETEEQEAFLARLPWGGLMERG